MSEKFSPLNLEMMSAMIALTGAISSVAKAVHLLVDNEGISSQSRVEVRTELTIFHQKHMLALDRIAKALEADPNDGR